MPEQNLSGEAQQFKGGLRFWSLMVAVGVVYWLAGNDSSAPANEPSKPSQKEQASEAARLELKQTEWVLGAYVSPGHMNLFVSPFEKAWASPSIGKWACAIVQKHGADVTWIRYVDALKVAGEGATVRDAEIIKYRC